MNNDSKRKIYRNAAIFIVVLAVLGTALQYLWGTIQKGERAYIETREQARELDKKRALRAQLEQEFTRIAPNAEAIVGALLDKEAVLSFIETLEKLADDTGVAHEIVSVREVQENGENGTAKIIFQLRLEGSFHNVLRFVGGVQQLPNFMIISQFTAREAALGEGAVESNISLEVFTR